MTRPIREHYRLTAKYSDTPICRCGEEMVYLFGSWRCGAVVQEQLAPTKFAIFKKE